MESFVYITIHVSSINGDMFKQISCCVADIEEAKNKKIGKILKKAVKDCAKNLDN